MNRRRKSTYGAADSEGTSRFVISCLVFMAIFSWNVSLSSILGSQMSFSSQLDRCIVSKNLFQFKVQSSVVVRVHLVP